MDENEPVSEQGGTAHLEASAPPTTDSVSDAPGEQKPAPPGTQKFVILALLLVLVAALGTEGYSLVNKSQVARKAADTSIASARAAISEADSAVEPGSDELTESQRSKSALDEATSSLA